MKNSYLQNIWRKINQHKINESNSIAEFKSLGKILNLEISCQNQKELALMGADQKQLNENIPAEVYRAIYFINKHS